jgi:glycosyltransferase involved in cell wall biosynthesis
MQPNLVILGPTATVISAFQEAGFKQISIVPYPSSVNISIKSEQALPFKSVWYAGAARQDKGFGKVVDLIKYVNDLGLNIPFTLQTSPDHYGKYDDATKSDITRLHRIPYKYIKIYSDTLSNDQYKSNFLGAICIQPYLASDFADRISGVTLDALLTGSPIVCSEGTWTARQVERFKAGIVFNSTSPADMLDSIEKVITDYEHYSKNARLASQTLQKEHSSTHLAKILAETID